MNPSPCRNCGAETRHYPCSYCGWSPPRDVIITEKAEEARQRVTEQADLSSPSEAVDHPAHYGGEDNPYEVIKVIEAWGLSFNLGNTVKYIGRHDSKDDPLQDLKKARWYLDREIARMEDEE